MGKYRGENNFSEKVPTIIGLALTVLVHAGAFVFVSFSGLKYLYPPPQDSSFLLEVERIEESPIKEIRKGKEPQSENVNKEEAVELVQKSESAYESKAPNLTPEAKEDDHGDVEVPAPVQKEEPKLDARASFPGMAKKDTSLTAPHSAEKASEGFKAGQADGNTSSGKVEGSPNAHVEGRNVLGTLPKPAYNSMESGTVIIRITVNPEGQVIGARYEVNGSTISSKELITAARNAAMRSKFTPKMDAPVIQEGQITYKFTLK